MARGAQDLTAQGLERRRNPAPWRGRSRRSWGVPCPARSAPFPRFQVAMDDPLKVGGVDGTGQDLDEPCGLAGWLWPAREFRRETAAGQVLQDQVRSALVVTDLEDLNDVGVLEPGDRLCLSAKSCRLIGTGVGAGQDHLEGDRPVEPPVPGLVDHAHPAVPDYPQDLVARDRRRRMRGALAVRVRQGQARQGEDPFAAPAMRSRSASRRGDHSGQISSGSRSARSRTVNSQRGRHAVRHPHRHPP